MSSTCGRTSKGNKYVNHYNPAMKPVFTSCCRYVGFTIHRHGNYVYTTLVAVTVVLGIVLLSWCCQPDKHRYDDEDD